MNFNDKKDCILYDGKSKPEGSTLFTNIQKNSPFFSGVKSKFSIKYTEVINYMT